MHVEADSSTGERVVGLLYTLLLAAIVLSGLVRSTGWTRWVHLIGLLFVANAVRIVAIGVQRRRR